MDEALLARVPGPVAVVPLASGPGTDYARTHEHGARWFRALGAEVLEVPDPRAHDVRKVLARARVVVLPGGSPSRLRRDLSATAVDQALRALLEQGGAVVGCSAGAMLLGSWTVLPEEGFRFEPGTGLVPGVVVVPHWGGDRDDWLAVIDRGTVLGLPEQSGVLVADGEATAVGRHPTRLVRERVDLRVGSRIPMV
jgi:cyanophycinase-like exopeptidase